MEQWLGALRLLRDCSNLAVLREEACQLAERLTGADGARCAIHESEYCVSRTSATTHGLLDSVTMPVRGCDCDSLCPNDGNFEDEGSKEAFGGGLPSGRKELIFGALQPKSFFSVPLGCDGERLGTLTIYFHRHIEIGVLQQRLLRAVADACAVALRRMHEASPLSRPLSTHSVARSSSDRPSLEALKQLSVLTALLEKNANATTKRILQELATPLRTLQETFDAATLPPPSRTRYASVVEVGAKEFAASVCAAARSRFPAGVALRFYARDVILSVEPGRLGELLLLLVEGAGNSLKTGRVVVGVSRRGSFALLRVFDQGTSGDAPPQYLVSASTMAAAMGVELEVSHLGDVVVVELRVPLGAEERAGRFSEIRPRVVVANGDASVRRALAVVLDKNRFDVVELEPGKTEMMTKPVELAILDYDDAERMRSETLTRTLRTSYGSEFPLIVLTSEELPLDVVNRLGRARVVRKPARVADLVLALRLMMAPDGGPRRAGPSSELRVSDRSRELHEATLAPMRRR